MQSERVDAKNTKYNSNRLGVVMSYITVKNQSSWPIHCLLTTAEVQRDCRNDVPKGGGYEEFEVSGWPGIDLTVLPATTANRFNRARNAYNISMAEILSIPFNPLVVLALAPTLNIPPQMGQSLKIAGKPIVLKPVRITGMYGPDGYNTQISGGDVDGDYDENTNTFTVKNVKPLRLHWENRTSHTKGDVVAPS
jgi:hypothetical protein